jgi:hypothetical protein
MKIPINKKNQNLMKHLKNIWMINTKNYKIL